jgi:uncharacterized membrane-anchored protein YitT (DUF2179 family)
MHKHKICSRNKEFIKREIGKWFLDIAKYIVTAVILKELFGGFDEKSIVVTVATATALFAFIAGMIILRGVDKYENDYKQKKIIVKTDDNVSELKRNITETEDSAFKRSPQKKKGKRK